MAVVIFSLLFLFFYPTKVFSKGFYRSLQAPQHFYLLPNLYYFTSLVCSILLVPHLLQIGLFFFYPGHVNYFHHAYPHF